MPAKIQRDFDPTKFLATIGEGRKAVVFSKKQIIFTQGDTADAIFYIQRGKVRLSVVSQIGKEATLGILSETEFFGEGALAGQTLRMGSATAMTDCELLEIDKKAMMLALHREHTFSDLFVAYLLGRNIRYEEDLVDQLFNSSEKRLARTLLLLAHFGKEGVPQTVIPKISQETLAEMVGTTRSRVSFFMNRFRKLGFVNYDVAGCKFIVHFSMLFSTIRASYRGSGTSLSCRLGNSWFRHLLRDFRKCSFGRFLFRFSLVHKAHDFTSPGYSLVNLDQQLLRSCYHWQEQARRFRSQGRTLREARIRVLSPLSHAKRLAVRRWDERPNPQNCMEVAKMSAQLIYSRQNLTTVTARTAPHQSH